MSPICLAPQVAALLNSAKFSRHLERDQLPKHIHWKEGSISTDSVIRKQRDEVAAHFLKHPGKNNWL